MVLGDYGTDTLIHRVRRAWVVLRRAVLAVTSGPPTIRPERLL